MEMAKLAREDEVFIIDEEVERGCICTFFTIPRCTHVAKNQRQHMCFGKRGSW